MDASREREIRANVASGLTYSSHAVDLLAELDAARGIIKEMAETLRWLRTGELRHRVHTEDCTSEDCADYRIAELLDRPDVTAIAKEGSEGIYRHREAGLAREEASSSQIVPERILR